MDITSTKCTLSWTFDYGLQYIMSNTLRHASSLSNDVNHLDGLPMQDKVTFYGYRNDIAFRMKFVVLFLFMFLTHLWCSLGSLYYPCASGKNIYLYYLTREPWPYIAHLSYTE